MHIMNRINLVVVGPGLMGKKHIELIFNNPSCNLAAIVAPNFIEHHEFCSKIKIPLHYDLKSCLSCNDVDGVIISSPNLFHAEQAKICIDSGIPVLIEKPITSLSNEGIKLLNLAEKKSAKILVGHHRAYSPILIKSREIIQQGILGRIVSVMGSALFYKPPEYFKAGPWRSEIGGGPVLINLIHEVGILRSLCGEISAVQAISSSNIRNYEVEDTVAINFQFTNGALGTFILCDTAASAKSWEQTSREDPSYPTYPNEDCYSVSGLRGSLAIPSMKLKYYAEDNNRSWWTPFTETVAEVVKEDPLKTQLEHFLEVIKGKEKPIVSAFEGLQNLIVTEAIHKAASAQSIIHIK